MVQETVYFVQSQSQLYAPLTHPPISPVLHRPVALVVDMFELDHEW